MRSCWKKNRASANRGRTTRWLPSIIADGSVDLHVADDQKLWQQLSLPVEQREVLLVLLHGENEAFLRHGEEFLVEFGDVDGGILDQCRDLVEQPAALVQIQVPAEFRRAVQKLLLDRLPSLFAARNDLPFLFQLCLVVRGAPDHELAPAHEAVTLCAVAAFLAEHCARHDTASIQHDEPVDGSRELRIEIPPAHELRDGQGFDALADDMIEMPIQWLTSLQ